jgi:hypothetical protein
MALVRVYCVTAHSLLLWVCQLSLRLSLPIRAMTTAAPEYRSIVDELFVAAGAKLHSYIHRKNREIPPEGCKSFGTLTGCVFVGDVLFV